VESDANGPLVVVFARDQDFADLLNFALQQEGLATESHMAAPDEVATSCSRRPSLLIVDLYHNNPEANATLLDALRTDPICRSVPVLALATTSVVTDLSLASYNVTATLTMPFDLDELVLKAREALGQSPIRAAIPPGAKLPAGILAEAAAILAWYSRDAAFRWLSRLQREAPWMERRGLRQLELLDHVPVLVEAVTTALDLGSADALFERHPETTARALRHARLRQSQGLLLRELIREYSYLREELWGTISAHLTRPLAPSDLRLIASIVNGTIDRIIEAAMPAWDHPPDTAQPDAAT
jgi:hypothetical protein